MSSDRIAVGIIRKAHGVRGEASIEPWTDSPERFDELEVVTLVAPEDAATRELRVESVRPHGDRALMKFAGIDSPEEIQTLHNWTVEIPADQARKLDEDEYFLHDLIGLKLIDAAGRERGVVTGTLEGGGGILLAVKRVDGKSFELPFAADLCTEIDVPGGRMVVALPEGLDDLDGVKE
ncbi:MAG TPA: ribosome maturation factor RimM [Thermoanaerobaculia bacterium]|jgi:16S rRNA processing protein RimM|nr:ribosome maturation factor RimM [Thermoanaerobaculia bacterium]